jgi:Signal transduction histidine kinase
MENGLPRNSVYSVVEDKYGYIWLTTVDGLCKYDGYKVTRYYSSNTNPKSLVNNRPKKLVKDESGNIWMCYALGEMYSRYNYLTDDFENIKATNVPVEIKRLFTLYDKRLWSPENSGYSCRLDGGKLCLYDKKRDKHLVYRLDQNRVYGVKDKAITCMYIDSNSVLWVTSDAGGVCYASLNQIDFKQVLNVDFKVRNASETAIRCITQADNGDTWIGTRKSGLARISTGSNAISHFVYSGNDPNSLANNFIRKLYYDRLGELWIGTKEGINRYTQEQNKFVRYSAIGQSPDNWVYAIEEDNQGDLWMGTWQTGLARYDRSRDIFVPYHSKNRWDTWNIRTLCRNNKYDLWIGTEGQGLTLFHRVVKGGKEERYDFINYKHNPSDENSLSDDRIYSLCKDQSGALWIGTGRGLDRFDLKKKEFTHFPEKRFISNAAILGILNDGKGNLWISHQFGLTRINSGTYSTSDYTTKDDLFNNEFSEDAYYRNPKTGEIFIGGNLGFISFNPTLNDENPFSPRVILTDLNVSGKTVHQNQKNGNHIILTRPLYLSSRIELNWNERNIEIEFAALHFANPSNNIYSYRLYGFDREWKNIDAANRRASYTNLPAGKYRFEVKAASSTGIRSKSPAILEIVILPPWWKTWWAYLLYITCAIGLIVLVFKIILTRQKLNHALQIERLKAEKIKELDELRSKFYTNVSHELRTPLTLIIDPVKTLLEEKAHDQQRLDSFLQLIYNNSRRLLTLVNQLLDMKRAETGEMQLNISATDVVQKVYSLVAMFELQASERNINLNFKTDLNDLKTGTDVDKLEKIIINLLSNAFKFTPDGGEIAVSCAASTKEFIISLTDNGEGIPADKLERIFDPFYQVKEADSSIGTGIGLALVREFAELLNGSVSVRSKVGEGTEFLLTFPLLEVESKAEHVSQQGEPIQLQPVTGNINAAESHVQDELPFVLIVEDNPELREYLRNILMNHFRVEVAQNGKEGISMAQELIPDLILSDVMMPVMTGLELCETAKSDMRTSHIPVVLLTARHAEESLISGFETGADDYITKPFSSVILIARIRNLIESRQKLRKLFNPDTGYNTRVISVNQVDQQFLDRLIAFIQEHISNPDFDIEALASMMKMSRVQLNRKVKSITDKTAQEFVLTIRLKMASEFLLSGEYTITEVSERIGYSELPAFTRSFKRQYGISPKDYINKHGL